MTHFKIDYPLRDPIADTISVLDDNTIFEWAIHADSNTYEIALMNDGNIVDGNPVPEWEQYWDGPHAVYAYVPRNDVNDFLRRFLR
jgi:hypothetical protein